MRAVQLRAYDGNPESVAVVELPVPRPGPGQVLIRVAASPINPSDLMFIRGLYGFKKPLPATPGFEGSGTVVEAGSGMMPRFLKGRRVACAAADPNIAGGMWAEYVVTSLYGSTAQFGGKRAVENAASWKSPKAGLFHCAWKSHNGSGISTFSTAPTTTG
jgi:NADPH:quinone reductase-like Zn-dependent oxidoreductase